MATVNNNVNQATHYVIDTDSGDWREARTVDEQSLGVTAENRRYHDAGDTWVAAKDGETAHADRSYLMDGDGRLIANDSGVFDGDGRIAFYQREIPNTSVNGHSARLAPVYAFGSGDGTAFTQGSVNRTVKERLGAYVADDDGVDGYDLRTLTYGHSRTYFDFTKMDGGTRVVDWDRHASISAQRFLDLMNDSSSAISPESKEALIEQAGLAFVEKLGGSHNIDHIKLNQTFQRIVEDYLKYGNVSMERLSNGIDEARQSFRMAMTEMTKKVKEITANLQAPTPGQKEAASFLDRAFSGTLMDGATNRFSTSPTPSLEDHNGKGGPTL